MKKISLMLIVLFSISFAKDYEVIHWNTVSFPPSLIPEGELKNKGYSDVIRNLIIEDLNEYKHNIEVGNLKLAITNLKRLEYGCFSGLNINENRKEFTYFSKPALFSFPNELTIKKSNASKFKKYLNSKGEISLSKILLEDKLILGYIEDRAYNSYIDELLLKYKTNKNIFTRNKKDLTKGLLHMLALDRIDYILEYPNMVSYNNKKHKLNEEFIQYPIQNASELLKVYVGCSKSSFGKKIIEKMNKSILKNKHKFSKSYLQWIPKESKGRYLKAIK